MCKALKRLVGWHRFGLRRDLACLAMALMAGCTTSSLPSPDLPLRNPTVTLAGTTRFDVMRFAGEWKTVACLARCASQVRYDAADGLINRWVGQNATAYRQSAPGILREIDGESILVVMWVDEGFRTAAVGDADGRWAAILDRSGKPSADRHAAAKEILDFNGWDVSQLRARDG